MNVNLPHGYQTQIDDDDLVAVQGLRLYRGRNGYVYFTTQENGRRVCRTLHAFLMGGSRPGQHIDHINGDKLDNRRANLRFATPSQNQVNQHALNRTNTSGVRGVIRRKSSRSPWGAQITANGKHMTLGSFATKAEAIAARRAAEFEHYGELCPTSTSSFAGAGRHRDDVLR